MTTPYYTWINIPIPSMYVIFTYVSLILEGKLVGKYTFRPMDASWDMMKYPSFENHPQRPHETLTHLQQKLPPGRDTQGGERTESNPTKPGNF